MPPADNGQIDRYRVKALPQGNPLAVTVSCNYASGENAHCEGLQGNTKYKASIEAWCGESETPEADYGAPLTTQSQLTKIDGKFSMNNSLRLGCALECLKQANTVLFMVLQICSLPT